MQLLMLEEDETCFLLDIGCGSGLSGDVLSEAGHHWVGLDISPHMLDVAHEREVDGDLFQWDMGHGLSFSSGAFDGCISISALQWLCNADKTSHSPFKRLCTFFQSLYNCLARGARAVFQFYPENAQQVEMIQAAALKCGFSGGIVVDFPNSTKAKKSFLCLTAGSRPDSKQYRPEALGDGADTVQNGRRQRPAKKGKRGAGHRDSVKSRDWIAKKKERQRLQGREVREDSKFSARRRRPKF